MTSPRLPLLISTLSLLLAGAPAFATEPAGDQADHQLLELSLEDLWPITVTPVSKKPQRLAETPAAVFVISADGIRRSGATNVPEALRLAPGVQVSAMGHNRWIVSIRGFSYRFSNKLLVLVDGRVIYSPAFSGVFWEHNDVPLENIDRIEVIRGPGCTIWGANAVNGVINIITRTADQSQGGFVQAAAGNELRAAGMVRSGMPLGEDTYPRLHAHGRSVDPGAASHGGDGPDEWKTKQAGFRLDGSRGPDSFSLQGNLADYKAGDFLTAFEASNAIDADHMPYIDFLRINGEGEAYHLLGRWERITGERTHSFQAYLDHSSNDFGLWRYKQDTLDMEYQQNFQRGRHDVVWGVGYRLIRDDIRDTPYAFTNDRDKTLSVYSGFIQDEINLVPDRWRLILGSRFEHNDYSGFEVQPNIRLLWNASKRDRVWAGLSRSVRTPSRGETSFTAFYAGPGYVPGLPLPLAAVGDPNLDSEKLNALDAGWRHQWSNTLTSELSTFYYRYSDLRGTLVDSPSLLFYNSYPYLGVPLSNAIGAESHGLELALDWLPHPDWRIQFNTTLYDIRSRDAIHQASDQEFAHFTPGMQLSLRASWDITPRLQWDAWLRHTGKIRGVEATHLDDVPAFTTLDMRLAWKPNKNLTLALVGQNLLDSAHPEAIMSNILSEPVQIQRGVYATIDWKF